MTTPLSWADLQRLPPRPREVIAVIDLFAAWEIAVFTAPLGKKGTLTTGWPTMDAAAAVQLARDEALRRNGQVNIAARTGPTARGDYLVVVDLDGQDGYIPEEELERALARLPEGVAVVRTFRGFTIWMKSHHHLRGRRLRQLTSDRCIAEFFGDAHLAQLPPSIHPEGVAYDWLLPPGGVLPWLTTTKS